jgi:hypothetical protein
MDEKYMEEERKDRKRKRRGHRKKMLVLEIVIFMFVIRNPKPRGQIKHLYRR